MSEERRNQKRLSVQMWVDEIDGGTRYFRYSGNLSQGGMFLPGGLPHAPGTVVSLQFTLPGDTQPVVVRAEVLAGQEMKGMRVRFVEVEPKTEARLKAFFEQLEHA